MRRDQVLTEGLKITMGDRNSDYGDPVANHENSADLWNEYLLIRFRGQTVDELNAQLDAEDVAMMMSLLKIARAAQRYHNPERPLAEDTFIDGATYLAIAAECRDARHAEEEEDTYGAENSADTDFCFTLPTEYAEDAETYEAD